MAEWKYIMLEHDTEQATSNYPIIFPGHMIHSDVAERVMRVPILNQIHRLQPVSAGFINFIASGCSGESESMRLASRPEDRAIINLMPYSNGRRDAMLAIEPMMLMKHVEHCLALIKDLNDD